MIGVNVKGGTGAGRKIQKTREPWQCDCWVNAGTGTATKIRVVRPGHVYSCPDCGTRRPEHG